ncbi:MAG: Tim44 domain-containing protein [Hyphomicrobiaceae bacterium]
MAVRTMRWIKLAFLGLGLAATGAMVTVDYADARAGRGGGGGTRGTRTYEAPPTTRTAPTPAKPVERSMTQPGQPGAAAGPVRNATQPAAQASRFGTMKSMLLGGLIGGMLASVLGTGALANVLGFMLQALLIGGLIYLAISFFRSRGQPKPALATASAGPAPQTPTAYQRSSMTMPGGGSPVLNLTGDDFSAFERLLGHVQGAYGRADIQALGDHTTPEMLSYFAGELDQDAKRGVRNELGQPKLLQGDLSEAWREPSGEWATVAMRYALTDAVVETATGKVVSGSRTEPQEVTEIWTFRRAHGGTPANWELSAIQQV